MPSESGSRACTTPAEEPLSIDEVSRSVEARGSSKEDLARAFELVEIEPLDIPRPMVESADEGREFWQTCAWVYAIEPRAARRRG